MANQRLVNRDTDNRETTTVERTDNRGSRTKSDDFNAFTDEDVYDLRSALDIPEQVTTRFAAEGYSLRWVRFQVNGTEDISNISMHVREHGTFVEPKEVPELSGTALTKNITNHSGIVTFNDVALMKFPMEARNTRKKYFEKQAQTQMDAVNQRLKGDDARASIYTPLVNRSRSSVATGKNAEFADE